MEVHRLLPKSLLRELRPRVSIMIFEALRDGKNSMKLCYTIFNFVRCEDHGWALQKPSCVGELYSTPCDFSLISVETCISLIITSFSWLANLVTM